MKNNFIRKNWKKMVLILTIFLITSELLMRIIGATFMYSSEIKNTVYPEDAKLIRIIAIGESTTADYFSNSGGSAWPRLLEKELQKLGVPARVYNEGLSGTSSPFILSHMSEYIEKYKPHIVISMMGINDTKYGDLRLMYNESYATQARLFLFHIRLVKLFDWFKQFLSYQFVCRLDNNEPNTPKYFRLIEEGYKLSKNGTLQEVEKNLRQEISNEKEIALVLMNIGRKLKVESQAQQFKALSRIYIERAFDLNSTNEKIAFWEMTTVRSQERCIASSRKILACDKNPSDAIANSALNCIKQLNNNYKLETEFLLRGFSLESSTTDYESYHYRYLHKILKRDNISFMAMQYPTLPISELQSYFSDKNGIEEAYHDIIFVSNQENFLEALKNNPYEVVFTDRFQGAWGHSNQLGHQLIAESALKKVLELIKQNKIKN